MTDDRPRAVCEACGKRFVVPDPTKTYACKDCGGKVRQPAAASGPACPSCGAQVAADSRFCDSCGAEQAQASARPSAERRRAASALARVHRAIVTLRVFYVISAVFAALATFGATAAFALPELSPGIAAAIVAVLALMTALVVIGAFRIAFQPFFWAVVLASIVTVYAALALATGGAGPMRWIWAGLALLFWLAVTPTVRARKLLRENPDLYVVHRMHGTHPQRHGLAVEDQRELQQRASARSWRHAAIAAGAIVAISGLESWRVHATQRPPEFETVAPEFVDAWKRADHGAIAGFFAAAERPAQHERLQKIAANRAWTGLPPIVDSTWECTGERAVVELALGDDAMVETRWALQGPDWVLTELVLPPPPFDDVAAAFVAAWGTSDPAAVARFFKGDSVERMTGSLQRMADRRNWSKFPAVVEASSMATDADRLELRMVLERGVLLTKWRVGDDDAWELVSLDPPNE